MAQLGFIGLGIMGAPMAKHLQNAGHKLFLYERRTPPQDLIDGQATVCTSAKEVAKRADIVFVVVAGELGDPQAVVRIYHAGFGPGATQ